MVIKLNKKTSTDHLLIIYWALATLLLVKSSDNASLNFF